MTLRIVVHRRAAPHLPRRPRRRLRPEQWIAIWLAIGAAFWSCVWLWLR